MGGLLEGTEKRGGGGVRTYGVIVAEAETEPECLVEVERVRVQDADVHLPFLEVVGGYEADAWGEGLVDLEGVEVVKEEESPQEMRSGGRTLLSSCGREGLESDLHKLGKKQFLG